MDVNFFNYDHFSLEAVKSVKIIFYNISQHQLKMIFTVIFLL